MGFHSQEAAHKSLDHQVLCQVPLALLSKAV